MMMKRLVAMGLALSQLVCPLSQSAGSARFDGNNGLNRLNGLTIFFGSQALALNAANIPSATDTAKRTEIHTVLETVRELHPKALQDKTALEQVTSLIITELVTSAEGLAPATTTSLIGSLVDLQIVWANRIFGHFAEAVVVTGEVDGHWVARQVWNSWDQEAPPWVMEFYRAWGVIDATRAAQFLIGRRAPERSFHKLQRNFTQLIVELSRPNADRTAGNLVKARNHTSQQAEVWFEDLLLQIARTNPRNYSIVHKILYADRKDKSWSARLLKTLEEKPSPHAKAPKLDRRDHFGKSRFGRRPLIPDDSPYTQSWLAKRGFDPGEIEAELESDEPEDPDDGESGGSAFRYTGEGLEKTVVIADGRSIPLDLHPLFNNVLDGKRLQRDFSLLTNFILPDLSVLGRSPEVLAFGELIKRITHQTTTVVQLQFIEGLRARFLGHLLEALCVATKGDVKELILEIRAKEIAGDVLAHAGTRGGEGIPTIYFDTADRPRIERLPPRARVRLMIHELFHLAVRLERGYHPLEKAVRYEEELFGKTFGIMTLEELKTALDMAGEISAEMDNHWAQICRPRGTSHNIKQRTAA